MIVGFTNGVFDCLHPGHVHFLRMCRRKCDHLIVAINTDASARRLKGEGRPVQPLDVRVKMVCATDLVGNCFAFDDDTPLLLIEHLQPHVIFKGDDYKAEDVVGRHIAKVVIIPRLPGYSTTEHLKTKPGTCRP